MPARQVGTSVMGEGEEGCVCVCVAPSACSDLFLACPGPTHKLVEPGKDSISSMGSVKGTKEVAGYSVGWTRLDLE